MTGLSGTDQSAAEADIERWRQDDLPIDIWGLDMDWRVWKNGEEGKGYFINKALFPDMAGFYSFAHEHGLSTYMNDHPMAKAAQLSPEEVKFRYDGLTSLFDLGLDFWWYDENWHVSNSSHSLLPPSWTTLTHTLTLR